MHLGEELLLDFIVKLEIIRVKMPHAVDFGHLVQVFSGLLELVLGVVKSWRFWEAPYRLEHQVTEENNVG